MKKYDYVTIERTKSEGWFIVRYKKAVHISTKYTVKNSRYILVTKSELIEILTNGLDNFLKNSMITWYHSKKALIDKNLREPFYKFIFE